MRVLKVDRIRDHCPIRMLRMAIKLMAVFRDR